MQHPDTDVCIAAMELAREHSPPFLFNHVMRTFAFGRDAGARQGARFDEEMLFLGAVLHDLGLVERFIAEDRFEIDGADAAADFLSRQGYSDRKIAVIWDAIALHTTLGVPQRKQPEIALVQLGAGIDVGGIPLSLVTPETVGIILAEYPRLGFKKAMLEAMGAVIRRKPMTGAFNLMGEIGRERENLSIPGICDVFMQAEFDE
ncbi:HD domain-containing protein [Arenibaculum pallidiluteum]|uniref:HD domain-containing protein n=1 Tax=Arenibaculum pallidiluteum TaxID=2812559 RepID=UPI001A9648E6|nr:HD domain-containing protein [Arenibaculum pallidiluteum]